MGLFDFLDLQGNTWAWDAAGAAGQNLQQGMKSGADMAAQDYATLIAMEDLAIKKAESERKLKEEDFLKTFKTLKGYQESNIMPEEVTPDDQNQAFKEILGDKYESFKGKKWSEIPDPIKEMASAKARQIADLRRQSKFDLRDPNTLLTAISEGAIPMPVSNAQIEKEQTQAKYELEMQKESNKMAREEKQRQQQWDLFMKAEEGRNDRTDKGIKSGERKKWAELSAREKLQQQKLDKKEAEKADALVRSNYNNLNKGNVADRFHGIYSSIKDPAIRAELEAKHSAAIKASPKAQKLFGMSAPAPKKKTTVTMDAAKKGMLSKQGAPKHKVGDRIQHRVTKKWYRWDGSSWIKEK